MADELNAQNVSECDWELAWERRVSNVCGSPRYCAASETAVTPDQDPFIRQRTQKFIYSNCSKECIACGVAVFTGRRTKSVGATRLCRKGNNMRKTCGGGQEDESPAPASASHAPTVVRDALVDARAFVCALADGQAQGNERPSMDPTRGTIVSAANQRSGAFSKLVEEVCALTAFIGDEPLHVLCG